MSVTPQDVSFLMYISLQCCVFLTKTLKNLPLHLIGGAPVRYALSRMYNHWLFTAREVVALSGIPYKTLDAWARRGFLEPSIRNAQGSGSRRVYDVNDVTALRIAWQLR